MVFFEICPVEGNVNGVEQKTRIFCYINVLRIPSLYIDLVLFFIKKPWIWQDPALRQQRHHSPTRDGGEHN
jgi:hypothetical protein